ncbi:MAG: xanthine dehydrogenase family protein molybdopterin-binding subunit [Fidelibacterota bacterium]
MGAIGKPTPAVDAVYKVTGQAKYSGDFQFSNQLYVKFLRSPLPHARIKKIDISRAEKLPGVRMVVTGKDIPTSFGVLPASHDETALAVDKVRYVGEIVAAVAAETVKAAQDGVRQIQVEYEPLPVFLNPEDSLIDCSPNEQIHPHSKGGTNIHKTVEMQFNQPEAELQTAYATCSAQFRFAGLSHAFTEPLATVAVWNPDDTLTVISATQIPHYLHRTLAEVLGIPLHRIQVKKPALGGAFGGKSDPFPHEIITAFLAWKIHRPVKCVFSREEVFINNHGRHPTEMEVTLGCDKTGRLTAMKMDGVIDGGAYASFGVVTAYYNGVLLQGPYKIDNFGFRTRRVYTNKPQCGAMRGHGAVNSRYAFEVVLDMLAEKVRMDPCDIRSQNFLPAYTETVGKFRITSNGVKACLDTVRKRSDWDRRHNQLPVGRGLGVACGFYISGSALPIIMGTRYPQTIVHAKLDFDGRVVIFSGASDLGQGSDTLLVQIAAEELGLTLDRIQVESADTKITPVDLGSYSSRVTFMVGNAAREAVIAMRTEICKSIARLKGCKENDLLFNDARIRSGDGKIDLSWDEGIEIALAHRGSFITTGKYEAPAMGGSFKGAGAGLSPAYSFGAFISEVEANPETGAFKVVKVWGAHDCGKALNPLAVEGQIEGCIQMGLGQVMSEDLCYNEGLILNSNFTDYRIPTALESPEMDVTIIESNDSEGPYGAKEAGEGPIHPVLPSIGNALYDALGVRLFDLPLTPDKILRLLQLAKSA